MTIRLKDTREQDQDWYLDLVYGDVDDEDSASVSVVAKDMKTDEIVAHLITFESTGEVYLPCSAHAAFVKSGYDVNGLPFTESGGSLDVA